MPKRTLKDVDNLIAELEHELMELPEFNVFGDSNEEEIEAMEDQLASLKAYRNGEEVTNEDVQDWLDCNKYAILNDYIPLN